MTADIPPIVVDTREKKPYTFDRFAVEVEERKLDTGDYTISGFEDYFGVERKSQDDLLRSITHDRERFKAEIERADGWPVPMAIVCEASETDLKNGNYYRDVHPNAVTGTLESWQDFYNVDFWYADNREYAERLTFDLLTGWYSENRRHLE